MGAIMTHPGGRPTLYTPELLEEVKDYLVTYEERGHEIPSIAGLACELGVGRRTLHDWAADPEKPEFSRILEQLLSKQEFVLFNKGLNGKFNSNIVKLALGKHGYHDKQDIQVEPVSVTIDPKDASGY